jgi:hypothetical protein
VTLLPRALGELGRDEVLHRAAILDPVNHQPVGAFRHRHYTAAGTHMHAPYDA